VLLRYASIVSRFLGRDFIYVSSKLASLFLVAIAISMIKSGMTEIVTEAAYTYHAAHTK
jgi:small neutral amino acid transporter SnatA (MarC family)